MARPLTRNQQLENAAFLKALRRTGNVRAAAREVGLQYGTVQHRRKAHPAFALKWDVAVAHAHARLAATGGRKGPEARGGGVEGALRTVGGEPTVVRLKNGQLQVRAAHPGKLTKSCEQAFLLALSATANVALSARAAGAAQAAFFRRRRRSPAFAREWRAALAEGYERLRMAVMAGFMPDAHEDDAWRHNDAPDLPQVTSAQALQLLYLHQKGVTAPWTAFERGRRGKPEAVWKAEVRAEYAERVKQAAEASLEQALAALAARLPRSEHEAPVDLPALDQVTGWSRADPDRVPRDPGRALFGGFRAEHQTPEQRAAFENRRRRG